MHPAEATKVFTKALDKLYYSHDRWNVFQDFLDYCLLMFHWWDVKQEELDKLTKKYSKDESVDPFMEAFIAMGEIADDDGAGFNDPFGDYFMEHFSNSRKGQFFTPQPICDIMTQISCPKEGSSVCDPTCGSGRTLLSVAKVNRNCIFYAADIDLTCCKMTAINFMLNSMQGEVAWMDTLRLEHWKSWNISKVLLLNGHYFPQYRESGPGETNFVQQLKNSINKNE